MDPFKGLGSEPGTQYVGAEPQPRPFLTWKPEKREVKATYSLGPDGGPGSPDSQDRPSPHPTLGEEQALFPFFSVFKKVPQQTEPPPPPLWIEPLFCAELCVECHWEFRGISHLGNKLFHQSDLPLPTGIHTGLWRGQDRQGDASFQRTGWSSPNCHSWAVAPELEPEVS